MIECKKQQIKIINDSSILENFQPPYFIWKTTAYMPICHMQNYVCRVSVCVCVFKFLNFSFVHYSVVCRMKRKRMRIDGSFHFITCLKISERILGLHKIFAFNGSQILHILNLVAYGNTFEHTWTHMHAYTDKLSDTINIYIFSRTTVRCHSPNGSMIHAWAFQGNIINSKFMKYFH